MSDELKTKMRKVSVVAQVAELFEVRLRAVEAHRLSAFPDLIGRMCSLSTSVETSHSFDTKEVVLTAHVDATVTLSEAASDGEESADEGAREFVSVRVGYDLDYQLPSAPPEEQRDELFEAFCEVNGTYNSWPYIRETVQSLTTRMGLPPLVLPVHRVPRVGDGGEESQPSPKLRVVGGGSGS